MIIKVQIDHTGRVINLGFDGQMQPQDSPMGLPFQAWFDRQNTLGRKCIITSSTSGTENKDREVNLEWEI